MSEKNLENLERSLEEETLLLKRVIQHLKGDSENYCACETEEFKELMEFVKTQRELEIERLNFYRDLKKKGIEYAFLAFLAWLGFKLAPEIFHK